MTFFDDFSNFKVPSTCSAWKKQFLEWNYFQNSTHCGGEKHTMSWNAKKLQFERTIHCLSSQRPKSTFFGNFSTTGSLKLCKGNLEWRKISKNVDFCLIVQQPKVCLGDCTITFKKAKINIFWKILLTQGLLRRQNFSKVDFSFWNKQCIIVLQKWTFFHVLPHCVKQKRRLFLDPAVSQSFHPVYVGKSNEEFCCISLIWPFFLHQQEEQCNEHSK